MKKALKITLWSISVAGIFFFFGFIGIEKKTMPCRGLEVNIDRSDNNYFIQEEEIKEMFFNLGYGVDTLLLSGVDIKKFEQLVHNNPSAFKADVYTTVDGKVKVDIKQRKPLLRIYNEKGESFYLDEAGTMMPLSSKFTARVMIANGNIKAGLTTNINTENFDSVSVAQLKDLFLLAEFISRDEFWKAQIVQLHVNAENEIELIPRVGNHVILLGDVSDLKEKFQKLMIFYKEGMARTGWNNYSLINLKFKNQVVCRKN